MQPDGYIDWIFSPDKKPYFVGTNGLVQEGDEITLLKPDGQPAHLQSSPDGWKDTLVKFGRSNIYLGLFREFTVPMRFTRDGAKILRYIFWNKGFEGVAYFAKHKLNKLVYPALYEKWFMGEPDFSKFKQRQSDNTVTINIMEGGLSKLLKASENTTFDIDIHGNPDRKTIYLDGVPFTNKVLWTVYNGQQVPGAVIPDYSWLGMGIVSQEGTSQGIVVQDVTYGSTGVFPNNDYCFWSISKYVTVRFVGKITGACVHSNPNGTANSNLILNAVRASDTTNTIYQTIAIPAGGPYKKGDPFSVDIDITFVVNPHERIYFRSASTPWTQNLFDIYGTEIEATYDVTFTPTFCECLKPITLGEKLIEKLTKGKYGLKSDFLTGLDDILYTSGPALRKYEAASSIKTSLTDFFQELKLRGRKKYSVGLSIENDKIVIEELDYFFRQDVIMDLGIVNDLEVNVAEDLEFNTIKIGYPNQNIDKVNGRDEFNITQQYTTPHTRIVKELSLISPFRADMYGVEVTRIELFGKDTTDNKADNDPFVLSAEKKASIDVLYYFGAFSTEINTGLYYVKIPTVLFTITNGLKIIISGTVSNNGTYTVENTSYLIVGFTYIRVTEPVTNEDVVTGTILNRNDTMWNLKRPAYSSITGLLHPDEAFNTELSPKRGLLNVGGLLHSLLDKQDINKLVYVPVVEKNSELSTTLAGVTIIEKADVVIGSLQSKLFLPYYFEMSTQVPMDFLALMKDNPYGKIKFTDGKTGLVLYGYLWDGGIKPEPNDKQTWKLIAAAGQDLTKFIN